MDDLIRRQAAMEMIRKMPGKIPIFEDARDVIDRADAQAEIMLLPSVSVTKSGGNMYINLTAIMETIKDQCEKQTCCNHCPFSATYRRKGDNHDMYYCKISGLPDEWQIDSACGDTVFYKVERRWLRHGTI